MADLKYTTVRDIETVLSPQQQALLTDDAGVENVRIIEEYISEYLSFAESIAESYVASRYAVPFETVTPAFKYAVLVIAKYNLMARRGHIDEGTEREYRNMLTWLMAVQTGETDLPIELDADDAEVFVGFATKEDMLFYKNHFLND